MGIENLTKCEYAVNQLQEMVNFCLISELKAISECIDTTTVPKTALIVNIVMNNVNNLFINSF